MVNVLLILLGASVFAATASVVMSRACDRSPLWNMALGGVLALAVLAGALIIAFLLTQRFPLWPVWHLETRPAQ